MALGYPSHDNVTWIHKLFPKVAREPLSPALRRFQDQRPVPRGRDGLRQLQKHVWGSSGFHQHNAESAKNRVRWYTHSNVKCGVINQCVTNMRGLMKCGSLPSDVRNTRDTLQCSATQCQTVNNKPTLMHSLNKKARHLRQTSSAGENSEQLLDEPWGETVVLSSAASKVKDGLQLFSGCGLEALTGVQDFF